ncbi:AAA family ATPase [Terasakiella sp. A23]|uniref:AAA family ATPase n=1 Tax=Terasakiella sp. FCG-A23 TaxID=3080561 RepID=UPI0029546270|nr:AAA family ATPase [Terasakiella sp. A23]MDV7341854.1 AAA family ATPase [Terasakiella sp. A23]
MMSLTAPFLKTVSLIENKRSDELFPFDTLDFLNKNFSLNFTTPITFFVGENGSGKSTIMEAIAELCGFHKSGGSHMHHLYNSDDGVQSALRNTLRPSWLPKVNQGYFFRSESFFNVARYIDSVENQNFSMYDGKRLHERSHGESFLVIFKNAFETTKKQIYLLDEPETALSPARQLSFLSLLHEWHQSGNVQLIIATHSPILLSYPNARIIEFNHNELREVAFEETEHYQITKAFMANPDRFLKELMD